MQIQYDSKTDLLYLRLDDECQPVVNRRVGDDVVLDIGSDDRVVGIEIMGASRHVRMDKLSPVTYQSTPGSRDLSLVHEPAGHYTSKPRKRRPR